MAVVAEIYVMLVSSLPRGARARGARFATRLGPYAAAALADMLADDQAEIRWQAANGLARIGTRAAPAAPALARALRDGDASVRRRAMEAIGAIGPEARAALPTLLEMLRAPDAGTRRRAATTVGSLGPAARAALPLLATLCRDKNRFVVAAATRAREQVGG